MPRISYPNVFSRFSVLLAAVCFLAVATVASTASAQGAPKEVTLIDPVQPTSNDGTIEVLEFFGYGCIHCANLEPALEAWAKKLPADVKFKRVPAGFGSGGVDDIPIFFTLEAMGHVDRLHKKIFEAIFNEHVMIAHKPTLLKWLEKQGVDPVQYESVERSFSVQSKITRGKGLAALYKVTATPMIVVNGRFLVQQMGGASNFL
ncbi:MAG: thiol:disulfide interchange protein DsbA/DsbL, partial [Pseudomonadota bacterium]